MSTQTFRYHLGDKIKDRISGLTGIITARSEHLFGCSRYWLSPQEHKNGKIADGVWIDEDSIEVVKAGVIKAQRYRVVDEDDSAKPYDARHDPLRRAGGSELTSPSSNRPGR